MRIQPQAAQRDAPIDRTPFSGWRILTFAVLAGALTGPGQTIGVSVFIPHFIADLGLSDAEVAAAYMAGTLLGALAMPRIGGWIDRIGVRRAMAAIGGAFGAALVAMSTIWALVPLALGFTFIRMFGQGSLTLVSSVAVSHWFDRRRGLAMGIMTMSVGILMSLVPVGLNSVIEAWGWRMAWVVAGIVIWAMVTPIGWFGMIDRPADVGQVPDGRMGGDPISTDHEFPSRTRREAMHAVAFWVAMAAVATQAMLLTALNFHQIALLGEAGLTATEAALMFLPQVLGGIGASLTFGLLVDRIGGRWILAAAMLLMAIPLLLVAGLSSTASIVLYAVVLGAAGGGLFTANAALMPKWFGVDHIGSIAGVATFVMVAASSLGPLALSIANTAMGSYGDAARAFIVIPLVVAGAALFTPDPGRPPN